MDEKQLQALRDTFFKYDTQYSDTTGVILRCKDSDAQSQSHYLL